MDGFTAHILPKERAGASFDVEKLSKVISKKSAETINKFKPLFDEPVFNNQENDVNLSYEDGFRTSIARITRAFEIVRENPDFMIAHMKQKIQMEQFFDHNGIFVHFSMFLNYLRSHADEDQLSAVDTVILWLILDLDELVFI